MQQDKVLRVLGLGSSIPLDKADPLAPSNRRISIVVLNKAAEAAYTKDGETLDIENAADLAAGQDPKMPAESLPMPPAAPTPAPARR